MKKKVEVACNESIGYYERKNEFLLGFMPVLNKDATIRMDSRRPGKNIL